MSSDPLKNRSTALKAGDICKIAPPVPATEYFDEMGIYFNPPVVLVLDDEDETELVRVAQLFTESALASHGDLRVGQNTGYYAECWNVYGMYAAHLSEAVNRVKPDFAKLVLEKSRDEFLPVAVNGPLWQFRQCELGTGSFFALRSVSYGLAMLEEKAKAQLQPWFGEFNSAREVKPCEYAYAAADGAKYFEDRRAKLSVAIHGSRIEAESGNSCSLGIVFLDADARPVLIMQKGIAAQLENSRYSGAIEGEDSARMFVLKPDSRADLRIPSDTPEIVSIRVIPLEND